MKATSIMKEKIFIKTNRIGYIPQLGMQGPIVNPYPTTRGIAKAMLVSGIQVFQIDPVTKAVTELTLQNVFPGEGDKKPVEEKKPETPKAGVTSAPVKPVSLQGVAKAPEQPAKVNETPEPEKVEEVAKEEKTDEKVEEAPKAEDSNKNQNQNNNNNGGKKNKKH